MGQIAKHITVNPEIRFGKPCIKGTRIAVEDVLNWLASEMSIAEIIKDFPQLSKAAILACLTYSANREKNIKTIKYERTKWI